MAVCRVAVALGKFPHEVMERATLDELLVLTAYLSICEEDQQLAGLD